MILHSATAMVVGLTKDFLSRLSCMWVGGEGERDGHLSFLVKGICLARFECQHMVVKKRTFSKVEKTKEKITGNASARMSGNSFFLAVCILGIYGSFLTWAVLQERISTTPYGSDMRVFRASHAINVVQSFLAFLVGYAYIHYKSRGTGESLKILPKNSDLIKSYSIVAVCQTLSSPLSYASLRYVDYITVLLAKSCKLVPVMLVHLLLHRTKFPTYKYVVVAFVTIGVSLFSIYQPDTAKKAAKDVISAAESWGFLLLGSSLFLDGLCNTTQDRMFTAYRGTGEISGPQMMVLLNTLTSIFSFVGVFVSGQFEEVMFFARNHPELIRDLVLYGLCGAIGQVFIYLTLEHFGSLVLVTTTVTRKMISMLLSVVMFNHKLTAMQWFGVSMVFGGIAGEALYKQLKKN